MKLKSVILTLAASAFLTVPVSALELTNDDNAVYGVEIILGEGDTTTQSHQLETGQMLSDVCSDGCTIRLSNGAELEFAGDETVSIKDGEFVLAE